MISRSSILDSSFFLKADFWLSEQVGYPVWIVAKAPGCGEPCAKLWTREPVFAYAKLEAGDIVASSQLADAGFRVVDTELTFDRSITGIELSPQDLGIRFSRPEDREALMRIAGSSFRFSRFHLDPLFPNLLADSIKSVWAGNYFEGKRGDGMVIAERDGAIVGFLQLLWTDIDCLVVDLIGLDYAWQGQGIGRSMLLFAALQGIGDGRSPTKIKVGTQAANIYSVRLYESLGFRLASAKLIMHFHGDTKTQ